MVAVAVVVVVAVVIVAVDSSRSDGCDEEGNNDKDDADIMGDVLSVCDNVVVDEEGAIFFARRRRRRRRTKPFLGTTRASDAPMKKDINLPQDHNAGCLASGSNVILFVDNERAPARNK